MTFYLFYKQDSCILSYEKEKLLMISEDQKKLFFMCRDETSLPELPISQHILQQESHIEREILLVDSGNSSFLLNGKTVECTPGDVFFINSNVPHQMGYRNIKSDINHIWFHLHPERFFAMSYEVNGDSPVRRCRNWELSLALLKVINYRWDLALHSTGKMRTAVYSSIARIIYEEISFQSEAAAHPFAPNHDIVEWMKNHISLNNGRNSSMEELEKLTGYNRYHLMRKFKNTCGMTIGEYINTVRRAFVALHTGSMPQKEIASRLGFKSPAAYWLWHDRDRKKTTQHPLPQVDKN